MNANISEAAVRLATSKTAIKEILLVDSNVGDAQLLRDMLNDEDPVDSTLTHAASICEAEKHLSQRPFDVMLLDLRLSDDHGLGVLRRARAAAPFVPIVVLLGSEDASCAEKALQQEAQIYLIKGQIRGPELLRAMRYAIERKELEDALFIAKERADVTLNCITDAVVCTDAAGNVTNLNLGADRMTGWSWKEAAGRPMSEVIRLLDVTSREAIANPMVLDVAQNRIAPLPARCILVRRNGLEVPIEDSVTPIHNRHGQTAGAVFAFRDISAVQAMSAQMTHSAEHDLLTSLPNRKLLHERVRQSIALARRDMKHIAVLYLDLDGFKHINESLGHPLGDQLLQCIAKRLIDCVRGTDTVSREGGDEFVILLSDVRQPEDAAVMTNRILQVVAQPHCIDQRDVYITTSIGVSVYPEDGQDAEELINNADTAMYQAKENGRRSFQFFKPAMYTRAVERQSIEEGLRHALERHEFTLQYQPKINLNTGMITGAEALLRWAHPTRGLLLPAQFIPVAENCGLIVPIGKWVLRQACLQACVWADAGLRAITMAVNVSATEFAHDNFLNNVFAVLSETGLAPRSLQLELTESVLMKRVKTTTDVLRYLREWGVQIAIDDFGTGYSSLSYLQKFSVDALKIDQSFIRQLSTGGHHTAIVTAVIRMARSLGLHVAAEGVETREEVEFLRALHCDEAQGYYFSRPGPPQKFAELLKKGIMPSLTVPAQAFEKVSIANLL